MTSRVACTLWHGASCRRSGTDRLLRDSRVSSDVCCSFVRGSACRMRPREETVSLLDAPLDSAPLDVTVDAAGQPSTALVGAHERTLRSLAWYEQRACRWLTRPPPDWGSCCCSPTRPPLGLPTGDALYAQHDCHTPWTNASVDASISKPLHLKSAGAWAAVLLLLEGSTRDAGGEGADLEATPTACVALHFGVRFTPRPPAGVPPSEAANGTSSRDAWEQVSHSQWCRDGADLLEGPLDSYTDCHEGLCQLTRKCKQRCAKRRACRYYTTYSSGFCQLSSRCEDEALASDPTARTFRKLSSTVEAER